jgi:hypothetical protein
VLLINNQDAATGTITYTNRWGIYQEGASDLNYFAANTLIGTTVNNGNKLQVSGTGTFGYVTNNTNAIEFLDSSSTKTHIGSGFGGTFIQNNNYYNGSSYVFDNNTLPSSNITLSGGTFNVQTGAANTNPSTKLTVDLAGNLGLGVTPSVWSLANASSLQIKNASFSGFLNRAYFGANFYWNNFGQEQYIANDYATLYTQATGQHIWYTAPSGTAGNAISFTQAMTLTSAGTLLIGTTTDAGQKLQVNGQVLTNREGLQFPAFSGGGNWQIGSDSTSGTGMYIYSSVGSYTAIFATTGNLSLTGSLTTGTPTGGTAAAWKLGSRVAATVVVNTTEYIEVDIGGTLYKLATVT